MAVCMNGNFERTRVHYGRSRSDVGLRNAILPGEVVLVPERPQEAERECCAGKQIAEAAPQELASVGQAAIEANDGKAAKLHSGRRAGERGEQEEILRVEQIEDGKVHDGVYLLDRQLPAERTE